MLVITSVHLLGNNYISVCASQRWRWSLGWRGMGKRGKNSRGIWNIFKDIRNLSRKTNCFHVVQLTTHICMFSGPSSETTRKISVFRKNLLCWYFSFNYKNFLCVFRWLPETESKHNDKQERDLGNSRSDPITMMKWNSQSYRTPDSESEWKKKAIPKN